jgi:Retroviral aspartyl protease
VTYSLLNRVTTSAGLDFKPFRLANPVSLVSATGGCLTAVIGCEMTFLMDDREIVHVFHVLSKLPYDVILGMDFVCEKQVMLDLSNRVLTLPSSAVALGINTLMSAPRGLPLLSLEAETLTPGQTVRISLSWRRCKPAQDSGSPLRSPYDTGFVRPELNTPCPAMMVVWGGLMTVPGTDVVQAWVSNFGSRSIVIPAHTLLAWWTPWRATEIEVADRLARPRRDMSVREHITECMTLADAAFSKQEDGDWEWQDAHMSADVDRVPLGVADPPTDASLQELRALPSSLIKRLRRTRRSKQRKSAYLHGR